MKSKEQMKSFTRPAAFFAVSLICALFASAPVPTHAQQTAPVAAPVNNLQLVIEGKVVKVHDGDTVTLLDHDNKKLSIRLQGIDAPELKQEFGVASQKNLSGMVLGKQVSILWNKVDKYRRTVGTIMLEGRDINIEQVKAGVAWHFKKYEDEQSPTERITYAAAEQEARAAKLGLWKVASPLPPGHWRAEVKAKRWGPPPPEGTIIGNGNSKKYHRPDCAGYRDMAEQNRVFFQSVAEAEAAGFRRAGNCPAEVVATKSVPAVPANGSSSSTTVPTKTLAATTWESSPPVKVKTTDGPAPPANGVPGLREDASLKTIGNKNSKIFHLPGCSGYDRVSEKNRVYFNSAAEAESAGYQVAKNCSADPNAIKTTSKTPSKVFTTTGLPVIIPAQPSTGRQAVPVSVMNNSALKTVGNKNSKIFHLPGCSGYDRVSEKNRIYFNSVAEAETAGYRIAKNCSPTNPD